MLETGDVRGARQLAQSLPFPPVEVPMVEAAQQLLHRYAQDSVAYQPRDEAETTAADAAADGLTVGPAQGVSGMLESHIDGHIADEQRPSDVAVLQQAVPRAVMQFLVRKKLLREGDWHVQRVLEALAAGCKAGGGRGPCQWCAFGG